MRRRKLAGDDLSNVFRKEDKQNGAWYEIEWLEDAGRDSAGLDVSTRADAHLLLSEQAGRRKREAESSGSDSTAHEQKEAEHLEKSEQVGPRSYPCNSPNPREPTRPAGTRACHPMCPSDARRATLRARSFGRTRVWKARSRRRGASMTPTVMRGTPQRTPCVPYMRPPNTWPPRRLDMANNWSGRFAPSDSPACPTPNAPPELQRWE